MTRDETEKLERPLMMDVVLAAWVVIEDREENGLDNADFPYGKLKAALEKLAEGVKPK